VIPSEGEALAMHRKHGSNDRIIRHCQTVAIVSELLAAEFERRGHPVDKKVVLAAALLHDIGRSRIQSVWHGVEGASMLEEEGIDREVVEVVRRHVGAGISREEARNLGLPDYDYVPRSLEERIVCFSDKMVSSDTVRPFDEEVKRFKARSHDVARLLALRDRLRDELGEDPEKAVFNKIKESQSKARV
jgi:uncharacterized protein